MTFWLVILSGTAIAGICLWIAFRPPRSPLSGLGKVSQQDLAKVRRSADLHDDPQGARRIP